MLMNFLDSFVRVGMLGFLTWVVWSIWAGDR